MSSDQIITTRVRQGTKVKTGIKQHHVLQFDYGGLCEGESRTFFAVVQLRSEFNL